MERYRRTTVSISLPEPIAVWLQKKADQNEVSVSVMAARLLSETAGYNTEVLLAGSRKRRKFAPTMASAQIQQHPLVREYPKNLQELINHPQRSRQIIYGVLKLGKNWAGGVPMTKEEFKTVCDLSNQYAVDDLA